MKFGHVGEFLSAFPELYALPLIAPIVADRRRRRAWPGWPESSLTHRNSLPRFLRRRLRYRACRPLPVAPLRLAPRVRQQRHPCRRPPLRPAPSPLRCRHHRLRPRRGPVFVPPYAVGPPGIGAGSGMTGRAGAGDKRKAAEPFAAAAAAAVGVARAPSVTATPAGGDAGVRSRVYGNEYQCRS